MMVPKVAIQFTGLAYMKKLLKDTRCSDRAVPVLAGITTGIVQACCLLTPFELVKVRQQTHQLNKSIRQLALMNNIWRSEGILGFYHGLSATIARQSWGLVVKFSGYEFFRKTLDEYNGITSNDTSPVLHHVVSGFASNVVVAILNSPPDVVKTKMQLVGAPHQSFITVMHDILKHDGVSGFFKGTSYRILRIAPGGAIQFGIYGYVMKLLS